MRRLFEIVERILRPRKRRPRHRENGCEGPDESHGEDSRCRRRFGNTRRTRHRSVPVNPLERTRHGRRSGVVIAGQEPVEGGPEASANRAADVSNSGSVPSHARTASPLLVNRIRISVGTRRRAAPCRADVTTVRRPRVCPLARRTRFVRNQSPGSSHRHHGLRTFTKNVRILPIVKYT